MIDAIVTQLATCPTLNQVARTDSLDVNSADSAATLKSIIGGVLSRVYPLKFPEGPTLPAAVYQLVKIEKTEIDGFELGSTDIYVVSVRAETFAELVTLADQIETAIATYTDVSNAIGATVVDIATHYDDVLDEYYLHIETHITTAVMGNDQSYPAAFVHPIGASASGSVADNFISQRVTEQFAVLLVAPSADIGSIRKDVRDTLLGYQPGVTTEQIEYDAGVVVKIDAHITTWRELYSYAHFIRQT